jgi:hypothetical protein
MTAAGYAVRENDPFIDRPNLVLRTRETSPYVNRIQLLWQKMREPIIERFPEAPGTPRNIAAYLRRVNETYVTDAYHSLSIEGYRVTRELIERVRTGSWNPETSESDREQRNAMAARGYWLAFQSVQQGVERVLRGDNPGQVADEEHGAWYRELFAPSIASGILNPRTLPGIATARSTFGNPCTSRPTAMPCGTPCQRFLIFFGKRHIRRSASCWGIFSSSSSIPTWTETVASGVF